MLISEKKEALYAKHNKRVKAATSSYSATGRRKNKNNASSNLLVFCSEVCQESLFTIYVYSFSNKVDVEHQLNYIPQQNHHSEDFKIKSNRL